MDPIKGQDGGAPQPGGKCPLCGKPRELVYRPFCSKRCADVDLHRWLGGAYAVPVTPQDDEDGDIVPPPLAPRPGEF